IRRSIAWAATAEPSRQRGCARGASVPGRPAWSSPEWRGWSMKRRDFVRTSAMVLGAHALPGYLHGLRVSSYLVPMDDSQAQHLKAYGVAFRALQRGETGEWLLNYRGGSFLLPASSAVQRDASIEGVTLEPVDAAQVANIQAGITRSNQESVPLEKAPRVAVYAPPNSAPWDDAVTMALEYAGIDYDRI